MLPVYFIKAIGGLNGAIPSPLQALRRAIVGDFRAVKAPLAPRGSPSGTISAWNPLLLRPFGVERTYPAYTCTM